MVTHKVAKLLVIETVNSQLKLLANLISKAKLLELDLSEVTGIDSAGIALLVELKQLAHNHHCNLTFANITNLTQRLCQLYKITL